MSIDSEILKIESEKLKNLDDKKFLTSHSKEKLFTQNLEIYMTVIHSLFYSITKVIL